MKFIIPGRPQTNNHVGYEALTKGRRLTSLQCDLYSSVSITVTYHYVREKKKQESKHQNKRWLNQRRLIKVFSSVSLVNQPSLLRYYCCSNVLQASCINSWPFALLTLYVEILISATEGNTFRGGSENWNLCGGHSELLGCPRIATGQSLETHLKFRSRGRSGVDFQGKTQEYNLTP